MHKLQKSGVAISPEVLGEFFRAHRSLPEFQGADVGYRLLDGRRTDEICLRLHLAGKTGNATNAALRRAPADFHGIPVQSLRATYAASPRTTPTPDASSYLTSGAPCASHSGGGQVAVMVVERSTNNIGFLTSWAAAGPDSAIGSAIYSRPNPRQNEKPMGHLVKMKLDQFGSAALCEISAHTRWLPIVRPSNQLITALKVPKLGEMLSVTDGEGLIEGTGYYRVLHRIADGRWKLIDIQGARLVSARTVASGSLVFDDQTATGVGMVCAIEIHASSKSLSIVANLPRIFAGMNLRLAGYEDLMKTADGTPRNRGDARHPEILSDPREQIESILEIESADARFCSNNRPDIATVVWPCLKAALDPASALSLGITSRVETLDPMGRAHSMIADAVGKSDSIAGIGVPSVCAIDFSGCGTFDQVCERICDLIERRPTQSDRYPDLL